MKNNIRILVIVLLLSGTANVSASPVTFNFVAEVTWMSIRDPFGGLWAGDRFTGTYTFDSEAVGVHDTDYVGYISSGAPYQISVSIPGFVFDNFGISVWDNYPGGPLDRYELSTPSNSYPSGPVNRLAMEFWWFDLLTLPNSNLPLTPPDITTAVQARGSLSVRGGSVLENLDFHVVSLSAATTPVPIPAAFWLFGSGLVGLVGFAYRQKDRSREK